MANESRRMFPFSNFWDPDSDLDDSDDEMQGVLLYRSNTRRLPFQLVPRAAMDEEGDLEGENEIEHFIIYPEESDEESEDEESEEENDASTIQKRRRLSQNVSPQQAEAGPSTSYGSAGLEVSRDTNPQQEAPDVIEQERMSNRAYMLYALSEFLPRSEPLVRTQRNVPRLSADAMSVQGQSPGHYLSLHSSAELPQNAAAGPSATTRALDRADALHLLNIMNLQYREE